MKKLDEHLDRVQTEISPELMAASLGLSAASLIMTAIRTYKEYFTKAARQCSDLAPQEKSLCMLRAKMLAKNVELQKLKGSMQKCLKTKDAQSCKQKVATKLQKIAGEIKYLSDRFKEGKAKGMQQK